MRVASFGSRVPVVDLTVNMFIFVVGMVIHMSVMPANYSIIIMYYWFKYNLSACFKF
jgi:hypothetical protein